MCDVNIAHFRIERELTVKAKRKKDTMAKFFLQFSTFLLLIVFVRFCPAFLFSVHILFETDLYEEINVLDRT